MDIDRDTAVKPSPIDAVVTWVDGNDPAHRLKKQTALRQSKRASWSAIPAGRNQTRFANNGELRYCIHAIRKFMPWIRTIHLVTDGQTPRFLDEAARERLGVSLVGHAEVFSGHEHVLPTFNSRSIETALHRIPGLADHYVYFNDDFIVLKTTDPSAFFLANGIVLRGRWMRMQKFGFARMLFSSFANHVSERYLGRVRTMHILAQQRAAKLAGMNGEFCETPHLPVPVRKKILEKFFQARPDLFEENIRYKFRDMRQFVTMPLARHLEIINGTVVELSADDHVTICFNRNPVDVIEQKISRLQGGELRFVCLQSLEQAQPTHRDQVVAFLDQAIYGSAP